LKILKTGDLKRGKGKEGRGNTQSPITKKDNLCHHNLSEKNQISVSSKSNLFYGNHILPTVAVNIAK
jgi:hypothetical protein